MAQTVQLRQLVLVVHSIPAANVWHPPLMHRPCQIVSGVMVASQVENALNRLKHAVLSILAVAAVKEGTQTRNYVLQTVAKLLLVQCVLGLVAVCGPPS